jgi:hypothetical protein
MFIFTSRNPCSSSRCPLFNPAKISAVIINSVIVCRPIFLHIDVITLLIESLIFETLAHVSAIINLHFTPLM